MHRVLITIACYDGIFYMYKYRISCSVASIVIERVTKHLITLNTSVNIPKENFME